MCDACNVHQVRRRTQQEPRRARKAVVWPHRHGLITPPFLRFLHRSVRLPESLAVFFIFVKSADCVFCSTDWLCCSSFLVGVGSDVSAARSLRSLRAGSRSRATSRGQGEQQSKSHETVALPISFGFLASHWTTFGTPGRVRVG